MRTGWILALAVILLALAAFPVAAQPVVSAKAGAIDYVEGKVYLGDELVAPSATKFPDIKENAVVRTTDGRAEVLLTPGIVLRLAENSTFRMISNRLIDTRVELQRGSAVVEVDAILKDNNVTVLCKDATVTFAKAGIYRFDSEPARLRVFKGEAGVAMGDRTVQVSAGKMLAMSGEMASAQRFDAEDTDSLDNWSQRRASYMAAANVSAARALTTGGYGGSGYGGYGYGGYGYGLGGYSGCMGSGMWAYNSWFGMTTFVPCSGTFSSPYGFNYWSPYTVGRVFYTPPQMPARGFGGGNTSGYTNVSPTAGGYSGTMTSSPSVGVSPMSSASTGASSAGSSAVGHSGGGAAGGSASGHGR